MARSHNVLIMNGYRGKDGCVYGMVALHRSTQAFSSNDPQPLQLCITPPPCETMTFLPLPELVERLLGMSTLNHTHACKIRVPRVDV